MESRKLYCLCCGKEIDLCPHCPTEVRYTPWRTLADSMGHFKLFCVAQDYASGKLSKADAKELLERIDTTGYEHFKTQTGAILREILAPEVPPLSPDNRDTAATPSIPASKPKRRSTKKI